MDAVTQRTSPPMIEMTTEDAIQFLASHNIRLRSSSDSNLLNTNRRGERRYPQKRSSNGNLSPVCIISGKQDSNSVRPISSNSNISAQDEPNSLSRISSTRSRSQHLSTSVSGSEISLPSTGGGLIAKSRAHMTSSSASFASSTRLPMGSRAKSSSRSLLTASSTRSLVAADAGSRAYPASTMARRAASDRDFLRSIAPLPIGPPDAGPRPGPDGGQRRLWSRLFGCLGAQRAGE